jgi:aryl-alcohol dehydrogenase-like predicted oxidoreductase
MNHRLLGRTNLHVSEIGFGALEIGRNWPNWRKAENDFSKPSDTDAIRVVQSALEAGINFFDTAPAYFESERLLGIALKGKRDRVILATKCGEWFDGTKSEYNYSFNEVFRFVENSLRNLDTDYIDVLQIHSGKVDVITQGETMAAMKRVQEQGKARYLGISVDSEEAALTAMETGDYDCIQVSYNLLNRSMESHVLRIAAEKNIGIIIKDGLATGRLTQKRTDIVDDELRSHIETFSHRAEVQGMPLAEYALRFILSHDAVSTLIVGTKNALYLHENISATMNTEKTLSIGDKERHR